MKRTVMATTAAAFALAVIAGSGAAMAADAAKKKTRYFVYHNDGACHVVENATKKTAGKKLAGPFKTKAGAEKRIAKLKGKKQC